MTDTLRFCVVRETTNRYQVTVYDPLNRILREISHIHVAEIMDRLGFELEQLQSRAWAQQIVSDGRRIAGGMQMSATGSANTRRPAHPKDTISGGPIGPSEHTYGIAPHCQAEGE